MQTDAVYYIHVFRKYPAGGLGVPVCVSEVEAAAWLLERGE